MAMLSILTAYLLGRLNWKHERLKLQLVVDLRLPHLHLDLLPCPVTLCLLHEELHQPRPLNRSFHPSPLTSVSLSFLLAPVVLVVLLLLQVPELLLVQDPLHLLPDHPIKQPTLLTR
jgi:hypothetical protein